MNEKLEEKQATPKKKSSAGRVFGAGLSKKKKSSSKKKKTKAIMVEPAKIVGKKKEKKGRVEAACEMAKRIAVESMSINPSQHVPTPDAVSDVETEV